MIADIQTGSLPDLLATFGDYLRTSDNEARQKYRYYQFGTVE